MQLTRQWYQAIGDAPYIDTVACSPDSRVLYSGGDDPVGIRCWELATGRYLGNLGNHTERITALAAHPRDRILASADEHGLIRLWDTATATLQRAFRGHSGHVFALAFSPDGALLASAGFDAAVRIWEARSGTLITEIANAGRDIAFSPDGQTLAGVNGAGEAVLWHPRTGEETNLAHDFAGDAGALVYHPSGAWLAVATEYTIVCCSPGAGTLATIFCGYDSSVTALAFDARGETIVGAMFNEDDPIRLWDVAPPHERVSVPGESDGVQAMLISSDGRFLACAANGRTASLEVWRIA